MRLSAARGKLVPKNIKAWNFRPFGDGKTSPSLSWELNKELNILIGENDAGKSAIIDCICARKQSESNSLPGRHLGDYWPHFIGTTKTPSGTESIHHLLSDPIGLGVNPIELSQRVRDVKRAILLALRGAGCQAVKDIRDASFLLRKLEEAGHVVAPVRALCHRLSIGRGLTLKENWKSTIDEMRTSLSSLLPPQIDKDAFEAIPEFEALACSGPATTSSDCCVVQHDVTI